MIEQYIGSITKAIAGSSTTNTKKARHRDSMPSEVLMHNTRESR